MENDKITIFDKKIDLYFSTRGHYCIGIYSKNGKTNNCEEVMILEKNFQTTKRSPRLLNYINNLAMHS